jgi:hypothetical protein
MIDLPPTDWLDRLIKQHDAELRELRELDHYYEGTQPLSYLDPELLRELDSRIRQVVINWPRLVVDALEERLDVEGFRFGTEEASEDLWGIWQANDLDEESQLAHVDALVMRRAYVIVGANEDDPAHPLITTESPLQVFAERDPRTRAVVAAVKRWSEKPLAGESVNFATLYLRNETRWFQQAKNGGKWAEYESPDMHGLDRVLVEPLVNRGRTQARGGVSELKDIVPLSDAACKIATDMMVSAEFHAMPRRWVIGMGPDDFKDPNGRPVSEWAQRAGALWASENTEARVGQFAETALTNFHETINSLAKLVASLSGLPPHFLGFTADNPVSADAIRSSEARLVKRAERRQRGFGGSWERVMRSALLVRDRRLPEGSASLETIWRDASTPTKAQAADAAVKLHASGLLPDESAWEYLGFSATQIERLQAQQASQATRQIGPDFAALLGTAKPADTTVPEPAEPALAA